jgi:hypothetical protein
LAVIAVKFHKAISLCRCLSVTWLSAISQNRPVIIEIKGLKTSHFKENKTAPLDLEENGSMGHVECPQSEPAKDADSPGHVRSRHVVEPETTSISLSSSMDLRFLATLRRAF